MNETTPTTAQVAADTSQQFSRANLFGVFLTLQLCQFTQPYGSLLFRGLGGLFWRCNPIASFVEACIIAWHLFRTGFLCFKNGKGFNRTVMGQRLRETASGLLLLRGAMDDSPEGNLMAKLMTGSILAAEEESAIPASDSTAIAAEQGGESDSSNTAQLPSASDDNGVAPASEVSRFQDPPSGWEPVVGVLRRRTTELEANLPPPTRTQTQTQPAVDPKSERSRMLHEAFGSNALAHREWRIDSVTMASELLITIKALFVQGVPAFTVAALFMILGWLGVQFLLLLFHIHELDEQEMASSVRTAHTLNAELKANAATALIFYSVLHLPFLCYMSYYFVFGQWNPTLSFFGKIPAVLVSLILAVGGLVLFFGSIALIIMVPVELVLRIVKRDWKSWESPSVGLFPLGVIGLPLSLWFVLGLLGYEQNRTWPAWAGPRKNGFEPVFGENPTMHRIVVDGFKWGYDVFWIVVVFAGFLYLFQFTILRKSGATGTDRNRVALGNAAFAGGFAIWYMFLYEPEGTFKPAWTDWLG